MVVSTNIESQRAEFEALLDLMVVALKADSDENSARYLEYSSADMERVAKEMLEKCAVGSPFEGTIELIAGQNFPDIIACNYYGVEVKTSKSNQWKSIGNSVAEGTRVKGVERIFMLFGKMNDPVDFMCKPYEECLSKVVVTHSPRYLIDMRLNRGETFFDMINIPYDTLRKQENPTETILDYYRGNLKAGQTTWWAKTGQSKCSNMVVRMWSTLGPAEKQFIRIKAFCLFPEVFSACQSKYSRLNLWLASVENVVIPNVRDQFTGGGQKEIFFGSKTYKVPRIIYMLCTNISAIKTVLMQCDLDELKEYWGVEVQSDQVFETWLSLVGQHTKQITAFALDHYLGRSDV